VKRAIPKDQRNVVCIQARTGSSRLPGKVLMPVDPAGETSMVRMVYNRCVGQGWYTLIAIPTGDKTLAAHLEEHAIPYVEGPEDDLMGRYHVAMAACGYPSRMIRVCADAPMIERAWVSLAVYTVGPIFVPEVLHGGDVHWDWHEAMRDCSPDEHAGYSWFEKFGKHVKLAGPEYRSVNTQDDMDYVREWFSKNQEQLEPPKQDRRLGES
jgi:hypothetical protein